MTSRPLGAGSTLLSIVGAALLLAGCGGSSSAAETRPASTAAATPAAPAVTASPTDAAPDCDVDKTIRADVTDSHITQIHVIGGCTSVSIETNLADSQWAQAQALCDSAAKVAYVGNVIGITVEGSSGREMAAGVKGQPCIGEPA